MKKGTHRIGDNTSVRPNLPSPAIAMTDPILSGGRKRLRASVWIFLGAMFVLHVFFVWQVRNGLRKGYQDFTIFYCAGKIVNLGLAHQLYSDQVQWRIQQSFAAWVAIREGPLPYNHPPFEALLFAPFAKLPFFAAFLGWDLLNLAMLVSLPFILRPYVALLRRVPASRFVLASLAFFPVCVTLIQGQDAIVMLLLFSLAYVALKRNADFYAGCLLGVGLFRFHQVLPVVVILLLCRRVKTTAGFALSSLVFGVISLALVGWHELLAYPTYLWHVENVLQRGPIVPLDMPTLRGFLYATLSSYVPLTLIHVFIAVLSVALIIFAAARWMSAVGRVNLDLSYSICLISSFLVSYHAYVYELTSLLLAVLLLLNHVFVTRETPGWKGVKWYAPLFLLFFTPLQMVLCLRYVQFHLFALVLMLWIWGLSDELSRRPRAEMACSGASLQSAGSG